MTEKILNLGCGNDYRAGAVNVDHPNMKGKVKADVWFDLENCQKIDADLWTALRRQHQREFGETDLMKRIDHYGYFDKVILRHVFEHINNVIPMMEEIYRLLKPGGTVEITCPYWTSEWAWGDIGHVRAINENTFLWFSKAHYELNKKQGTSATPYCPDCDFKIVKMKFVPTKKYRLCGLGMDTTEQERAAFMDAKDRHLNVVEEIRVTMEAIKNG